MIEMIYKPEREIEILDKGTYCGYNFIIVSYGVHPCAYVQIPKNNKYYEIDYDSVPVICHGGLTFSGMLSHIDTSSNWYIGWDYAHLGDYVGYNLLYGFALDDKKWTTEEIFEEVKNVINQLEVLCNE